MNPLPVSLDLTSNSTSKPSAKTSDSHDVDADKFKKELNKQENSSQDKDLSSKAGTNNTAKQNDTIKNEDAATAASENAASGEELPPQVEDEQQNAYTEEDNRLEEIPEPLYLSELGIPVEQATLYDAQPSVEGVGIVGVEMSPDGSQATAMVLEDEVRMFRSLNVSTEEGISQLPYSPPGALAGQPNTLAANGVEVVSDDSVLDKPLEKLMTLEQMKQSLEKGVETLAELEVDVDTDNEGTIREVFRFNDIQLKESQSTLKTYTTSVELPVSPGAWADKVNDKIIWLANQKIQFAEIHLNPQDLGPMEVKISVQNDQATVTFNSQHQGVRELLELNVNRLREMMSENGVDLAHVDVSDQSSQQQPDDEEEGGVAAQSGDGDDELSGLSEGGSITDAISLNNLVDYYA